MLGQVLVTKQTGEDGKPVNTLLMVERVFIRRELYISIMLDRQTCGPLIVASQAGGTSIEDVAKATPEKIFKVSPFGRRSVVGRSRLSVAVSSLAWCWRVRVFRVVGAE